MTIGIGRDAVPKISWLRIMSNFQICKTTLNDCGLTCFCGCFQSLINMFFFIIRKTLQINFLFDSSAD